MSGSVDDEVVRMRFDNSAFERGVSATLGTLAKLKNALSFSGADKGLSDIEAKAKNFDMSAANKSIDDSAHHWSAWKTAGLIAFATVVHRAVDAGINVVKSFTIDPLKDGFENYQNQINATKIILSNTAASGAKLKDVTGVLDEMQKYAQLTVYNFADMAKNVGTFTANGVALKPAAAAIKGIANVAALSGASSEDASRAMYQLSQALGQGSVKLQDWNSVQNANIGTNTFKNALVDSAVAMGTLSKNAVKFTGPMKNVSIAGESFRNSLTAKPGQTGWLTSKVLTNTLAQFTGQVSKAQLLTQGFTAAQADAIIKTGKMALNAATQVKTWDQLTQALKEEVSGAYAQVFKTIFGDLPNATKLFSALHTVLENMLTGPILGFNKLLQGWAKLGGRVKFIDAFKSAFHSLGEVFDAVSKAYRSVFPATTSKQLVNLTNIFSKFASSLAQWVQFNKGAIQNTFKGIFAIFDIGKQVVGAVFHVIGQLFGMLAGGGTNPVLTFTATIGLMLVKFDQAIKKGGLLRNAVKIIGNVIHSVSSIIGIAADAIGQLFSGFRPKDANGLADGVTSAGDALARVAKLTQHMSDFFANLRSKIQPGIHAVVEGFSNIGAAIAKGLGSGSFANILSTLQVGLLGGIVVMLKKFFAGGIHVDVGGGFLGKAGGLLDSVTGKMKAMQTELKAKALLEIAAALGILVASMVALSFVNAKKLQSSLSAMAVGFGELLTAMGVLVKIAGSAGFVKIPILAASLNLLAGAILLLTTSVLLLSRLSWDELERGLTGVGILLAAVSAAAIPLSANSSGMIRAGLGIAAMAVGLDLLFIAVKGFSTMSWSEMLQGLSGVGIALAGIAIAMHAMPKGMVLQAGAILILSVALNALYLAVREFSSFNYGDMVKGLIGVAGALTAIGIGMHAMPEGMLLQSVALIAVGAALQLIARAVESMGKMSWSEIGKGLATLAGSLVILAGGLLLMEGSIGGATALLIVAGALHVFVPALQALSKMSWAAIASGLGALAATFAVIGGAAALLTPVIPAMLGLGAALALVGVAMLAFGAGAVLLGAGLAAIAASGGAAIAVLISGLKGLIALLPVLGTNLALFIANFITVLGKNAPAIIGAFVKILNGLLQAVPKIMPSLIAAINSIVQAILTVLVTNAPKIIAAGFQLLMDLLNGIKNNIGQITKTVADIIVRFLNALASNIGRIIQAGVNLLTKFLIGIASALGKMPGVVLQVVAAFLRSLLGNMPKIVSMGITMLGKLVGGIISGIGKIGSAALSLLGRFLSGIASGAGKLASAGLKMLTTLADGFVNGIGAAVTDMAKGAADIASALIDGIIDGLKHLAGKAVDAVKNVGKSILHGIGSVLHIGGPSREFMDIGEYGIGGGLIKGLDNVHNKVVGSVNKMGSNAITSMKKTISGLGAAVSESSLDYQPTITPVLDLTQFNKDASTMGSSLSSPTVTPDVSYQQASDISLAQRALQEAEASTPAAASDVPPIQFVQHNTSPTALSEVDIYRQTRNQLSQAKDILSKR